MHETPSDVEQSGSETTCAIDIVLSALTAVVIAMHNDSGDCLATRTPMNLLITH